MEPNTHEQEAKHEIDYIVDDEPQSTTSKVLTPRQILTDAGIDPASHYLVQLQGQHQISYKDTPDVEIKLHEHMKFISISTGPTPVS
jgi:hypothetical protein